MPHSVRHPKPYQAHSRRHRRNRFVSTRWRINCDPDGQGVFTCRHALPQTALWQELGLADDALQSHADIWFLSRRHARQGWWYSARISTVEQAVGWWLEQRFQQVLDARMSVAGLPWQRAYGNPLSDQAPSPLPALRELAGPDGRPRTVFQFLGAAWSQVDEAAWTKAPVETGVDLDLAYPHAVGLSATLPATNLTPAVLAAFVEDFWALGEVPWHVPVDWDAHAVALGQMAAQTAAVYERLGRAES